MIVPDAEYPMPGGPDWLAAGENQVWTTTGASTSSSGWTRTPIRRSPAVPVKDPCSGLAVAHGTLWAPSCVEGVIYRIDTTTNQVVAKVPVAPGQ
jgi:hypothetical protein